jgi:hypothetical protein
MRANSEERKPPPMTIPAQDADTLVALLADGCRGAGLEVQILAPTRVRVGSSATGVRLSDIVRCMPDQRERLFWWWSWNEPICPAEQIAAAVTIIRCGVSRRGAAAQSAGNGSGA